MYGISTASFEGGGVVLFLAQIIFFLLFLSVLHTKNEAEI